MRIGMCGERREIFKSEEDDDEENEYVRSGEADVRASNSRKAASSAGVDEFCDPGGVGVEAINVKERLSMRRSRSVMSARKSYAESGVSRRVQRARRSRRQARGS